MGLHIEMQQTADEDLYLATIGREAYTSPKPGIHSIGELEIHLLYLDNASLSLDFVSTQWILLMAAEIVRMESSHRRSRTSSEPILHLAKHSSIQTYK